MFNSNFFATQFSFNYLYENLTNLDEIFSDEDFEIIFSNTGNLTLLDEVDYESKFDADLTFLREKVMDPSFDQRITEQMG